MPNASNRLHKDNIRRGCVIAIPIFDISVFATTKFWHSTTHEFVGEATYLDGKPNLLNLQQFHSVDNNNSMRLNFQLSFHDKYQEVKQRILNGTLFRKRTV
jgi:hypothetical protein